MGEAFRALVRVGWVRLSYGVASAYVVADTNDKAGRMRDSLEPSHPDRSTRVAVAAFDTLVWQALASVIIPGEEGKEMTTTPSTASTTNPTGL